MSESVASIDVSCFDVSFRVESQVPDLKFRAIEEFLPPGSEVSLGDGGPIAGPTIRLESTNKSYRMTAPGFPEFTAGSLDEFVEIFSSVSKLLVADRVSDRVVVHAGVVDVGGRAVVLPGSSHAGKSTLVLEMIRRGAGYLSDDLAVFDSDGFVHPYEKPLTMRDQLGGRYRVDPKTYDVTTPARPLPVGMIVFTHYHPRGRWNPESILPGEATLKLLANTVSVRRAPRKAVRLLGKITRGPVLLSGRRGDASEVAQQFI